MVVRRRLGSRLDKSVARAVARRRIFPYLAGATVVLALVSGLAMILVDRSNFPNYGIAVWWAIVTLATVGYGDVVPTTPLGRIVGSAIIILGVTFLAFLTATVTSLFVSSDQEAARERELADREAADTELRELLHRLEERLAAIEAKLEER
jgi:voltage-gated potassium channel